jgi:hypothetical protein
VSTAMWNLVVWKSDVWGLFATFGENIFWGGFVGEGGEGPFGGVWRVPTMPLPPKKCASRLYMCMLPPMPLLAPSTRPISSAITSSGVPPLPRCVQ